MKPSKYLVLFFILLFVSLTQADSRTWSTQSEWSSGSYNNIDMGSSFHLADSSGGSEVDYWDRTNLGPYSGATGQASTETSPVQQGSHSLLTSGNNDVIYSSSGLPNYPTPGDTFSVWIRSDYSETAYEGPHIYWGRDRSYSIRLRQGDVYLNGPCGEIDGSGGTSMNANAWYELVADWQSDGDVYIDIYDTSGNLVESYGGTCYTASSGSYAIGFRAGGYGNSWYDGWSIDSDSSTYETSGYVRTGYKDFGQNMDPNSFDLNNLNYNLNGESISVQVEADTGDTSDTINLGGSSSYSVSGLSDEADRYRLYIDLSGDGASTPSMSSATLQGQVANNPPDAPSNPAPYNGESAVSTTHNLNVDVSDPDGDSMDVDFYIDDGSGFSLVGTDTGVCSGCTAGINPSLSTGTTYDWYAVADDGSTSTTSSTWSFTTVHEPNQPSNPDPFNGEGGVPTSHNLHTDVSHPDGLSMDVDFYVDDGSGYSYVGTDSGVADGGTASINPSLSTGTNYGWYAVAKADGHSTQSPNWGFTTNYVPSVDSVSKTDSSSDHAFSSVSAMVSDPDGSGDLSSATLTIDDGDGNTRQYSGTIDTSAGGSNEAGVSFGSVSYGDDSGWGGNENVQLEVEATDSAGRSDTSSILRRFPNHAPTIVSGYSYTDDPANQAFTLDVDAQDVDDGAGEITSCTVEHNDQDGNSYSNSGSLAQGETATCSFTIDDTYSGYKYGEIIEHRVTFQDVHGKTVTTNWGSHRIPNSPPSATNLQPSGGEVQYGPTLNATYNDPNGDSGNLTFYNTSSGNQIGKVTGLADGQYGTVQWSDAETPGTTYNFTVEASDGVNATNSTENFTTIYEPKAPYDPDPSNESTVDTTTRTDDEIAASVKVVHPDDRPMNVEFINRSNGQIMEIDYNVDSGTRAKITNIGNSLRDETNKTYKWKARSYDTGTGEYTDSNPFTFHTVEVGDVIFDVTQGADGDNMDVTGNSDNGWTQIEFEITSSQMDPIPAVTVNETSTGDLIKSWSNVENNSVLSVNLDQSDSPDWNLATDSEYEYFIEASEGPNILGQSLNHTIYTYNVSLDWNRAERYYDVYQYDVYRAQDTGSDLIFDYGNGDYNLVGSLPRTDFNESGPGLESGTFCWKVAASNPSGSSDAVPIGDGECRTLN